MLTPNAVRLSALVAAAVSAGYLWRAALDHNAPQKVLVAVPPALHVQPDAPGDLFNSLSGLRTAAVRIARQEALPAGQGQLSTASAVTSSPSGHASGASSIAYVHAAPGASSSSHGGSAGSGGSGHALPTPKPPRWKPPRGGGSKPPPPPAPPGPPAPPAPPAPHPPPPPPPPAAPPAAPPPPPPVGGGTKPGWGKGDKNHVHTGPPGSSRRSAHGKTKREPSHGQGNSKQENEGGNQAPGNPDNAGQQQGNSGNGGGNQGNGNGHGNGNGNGNGGGHGNHH